MSAEQELTFTSHGVAFDRSPDKFGWLRESQEIAHDKDALQERMTEDGYLFMRGILDKQVVLDARRELLEKLDSVEEIDRDYPLMEAIFSGRSNRANASAQNFAQQLRLGEKIRALVHGGKVIEFYETFFGDEVRPFDFIWLRAVRVGAATGCHYDWVYMGRGTKKLYTSWIPIGDVPYSDGALCILENSHKDEELVNTYGASDVDDRSKPNPWGGWFTKNPLEVQEKVGGRWLTAGEGGFRTGDMLVFGMWTMHCSMDNRSPVNRIRLSSDTRYQLASEPADHRWVGDNPIAHGAAAKRG